MTKKELIGEVAAGANMTKKDAETVINKTFDAIMNGVKKDGIVQIMDFITIESRPMEARKGRNPKTGDEIDIPARNQLFAKFGKGFKDFVNK